MTHFHHSRPPFAQAFDRLARFRRDVVFSRDFFGLMVLVILAGALPSCGAPAKGETIDAVTDAIRPECEPWGCGSNAATLGLGMTFHELDPSGNPNSGGLRVIRSITQDGRNVSLHVVDDELTAVVVGSPPVVLRDINVRGIQITLLHEPSGRRYELRIADVFNGKDAILHFWAGDPDRVPAYVFQYRPAGSSQYVDVCRASLLDPEWSEGTGYTRHAVVFNGDRYDAARKTVYERSKDDASVEWFNIACAGTALAKMHLLRHTRAGSRMESGLSYATTIPQRQAMLKMLVADYCGNGEPHTEDGTPLHYMDPRGFPTGPHPLVLGRDSLESVWVPGGAACLSAPRLFTLDAIECAAALPPCPDPSTLDRIPSGWWSGSTNFGYVVSAKPGP